MRSKFADAGAITLQWLGLSKLLKITLNWTARWDNNCSKYRPHNIWGHCLPTTECLLSTFPFNPFPHYRCFPTRLQQTTFWKHCNKRRNLLKTSNFSFSNNFNNYTVIYKVFPYFTSGRISRYAAVKKKLYVGKD